MSELAIPDPCVVLLVGAAGAGKSTFAARHFCPDAILSSDALREAIAGQAADQSATKAAFAALHRALDRRLAAHRLTVVDATNVTAKARLAIRRIAARYHVPVVAILLDLPADLVHRRNAARRERPVPAGVVSRHLDVLSAAVAGGSLAIEGYAAVIRLVDPDEVDRLTVRLVPPAP